MKPKTILLLALITITCTSMMCECDDKTTYEPQLPPETTTGANTFGCLVNGKVWRNGGVGFPNLSLSLNTLRDSTLIIEALRNNNETKDGFALYITNNLISEKKYILDSINVFFYYSAYNIVNNNSCTYQKWGKGFIELTRFDLKNNIVSGRFEATLYNTECDSIVITQGRFDLKK